ncbi:Methyltransferase domain protein [uncultured archaeon]|nr:Methyltransferase domain protein [uncultured archaeon]
MLSDRKSNRMANDLLYDNSRFSARARHNAESLGFHKQIVEQMKRLRNYLPVHERFIRYLGDPQGKQVLEIGGDGLYTKFLQKHGAKATAFEINPRTIQILKGLRIKRIVQGDARQQLPFADCSLDGFVSSRVLFSHLGTFEGGATHEQSVRTFADLFKLLRPGGIGLVYECYDYQEELEKVRQIGFEVLENGRSINRDIGFGAPNLLVLRKPLK